MALGMNWASKVICLFLWEPWFLMKKFNNFCNSNFFSFWWWLHWFFLIIVWFLKFVEPFVSSIIHVFLIIILFIVSLMISLKILFVPAPWNSLILYYKLYLYSNTCLTTGKIVFAAPSRPLVMQQIEACHNVVGIPQVRPSLANRPSVEIWFLFSPGKCFYTVQSHILTRFLYRVAGTDNWYDWPGKSFKKSPLLEI